MNAPLRYPIAVLKERPFDGRLRRLEVDWSRDDRLPSPRGNQFLPLNSTSMKWVFGYFLRKARSASRRLAEKPPSSSSGLSLKNEAISPPLSSKMRTDIRTPDPLLPMNFSQLSYS